MGCSVEEPGFLAVTPLVQVLAEGELDPLDEVLSMRVIVEGLLEQSVFLD